MKMKLVALAAMVAAGAASAQSSVTLFGIVDVGVSHYSVSGGQSVTKMTANGYNSDRIGVRGQEDLGGGMSASFWLEGAMSPQDGTASGLSFTRRSTVSLAGNWGELRLGRDYTPSFWNLTIFDPFGTNGVGTDIAMAAKAAVKDPTFVRSNNAIGYFLPSHLGGFYGQVQYAFSNKTADKTGQYQGLRVGYAAGPVNVALALGNTATQTKSDANPEINTMNIGGSWDFGVAQALAMYDDSKYDNGTMPYHLKTYLIGGLVPVGAGQIRASYGNLKVTGTGGAAPEASQWALGYVHNLSKRTALYATYAHLSNKNGANLSYGGLTATGGASGNGYDLGIRHSF
ncbi:MAG: porin [Burkholderiales bacterium]|nr:porin [Burkholderiales bacterium]